MLNAKKFVSICLIFYLFKYCIVNIKKKGGNTVIRKILILLVLISSGLGISCSPTTIITYKEIDTNKFYSYEIIELPNFDKTTENWVPYDSNTIIPDMVADSLESENLFSQIIRTPHVSPIERDNTILVKGIVTDYNRGCKFCEWFIRLNDKGKSSITVRIQLIDKKTGEIITEQSIKGRAKSPGYGESRYFRVRDKIVSMIKQVRVIKS